MLDSDIEIIKRSSHVAVQCMIWAVYSVVLDANSNYGIYLTLTIAVFVSGVMLWISRQSSDLSFLALTVPVMAMITIFFVFSLREHSDGVKTVFIIVMIITGIITTVLTLMGKRIR